MNLVSHIIQILESDHEVTLPSLGKFQLIYNSALVDNISGKTYPPYYSVTFSQQYNINNNAIFSQISKAESIEESTVQTEYSHILSEWKTTLKKEANLNLKHLGNFMADKEKITFEMTEDCIFNFKNFGLPTI